MKRIHVLFAGETTPWIAIENGVVAERGDDFSELVRTQDDRCILIAPAGCVAFHERDLPDLSPAQAMAAARHMLAEKSLLSPSQLIMACGEQQQGDPPRPVVLAARTDIVGWINAFDPDVILPVAVLLPRPEKGYVRAILAHETVLRGCGTGFAEDDHLTPILIGDAQVETLGKSALEAALVKGVTDPPLNLRRGEFAKRRPWSFDRVWIRQMVVLGAAILGVTLAIPVVQIVRLNWQSITLEETSASLAQAALGGNVPPETALAVLDARLSALRGGGAGFANTNAAVMRALEATANVELVQMGFDPDGTMRLSVRATSAAEIGALRSKFRTAGLEVIAGPVNLSQTQPVVDIQVRGQ